MLKRVGLTGAVERRVLLVMRRGSGVYTWLDIELVTIGFLGLMLEGCRWETRTKYLSFGAVSGALLFWGMLGRNRMLVLIGLGIKLGIPPFHVWVKPVASALGTPALFFTFLFSVKLAPV